LNHYAYFFSLDHFQTFKIEISKISTKYLNSKSSIFPNPTFQMSIHQEINSPDILKAQNS
jgi:hypothetical protein